MKTSRRGFIGRLIAAVAAPVIPAVAVATTVPVLKTVYDEAKFNEVVESYRDQLARDFDGDVRIVVQPRYQHTHTMPIVVTPGDGVWDTKCF